MSPSDATLQLFSTSGVTQPLLNGQFERSIQVSRSLRVIKERDFADAIHFAKALGAEHLPVSPVEARVLLNRYQGALTQLAFGDLGAFLPAMCCSALSSAERGDLCMHISDTLYHAMLTFIDLPIR